MKLESYPKTRRFHSVNGGLLRCLATSSWSVFDPIRKASEAAASARAANGFWIGLSPSLWQFLPWVPQFLGL
jgi:hypothetical protein